MAERNTGIAVALVVVAALAGASILFMFAMMIDADEARQVKEAITQHLEAPDGLDMLKQKLESDLREKKSRVTEMQGQLEDLEAKITEQDRLKTQAQARIAEVRRPGNLPRAVAVSIIRLIGSPRVRSGRWPGRRSP